MYYISGPVTNLKNMKMDYLLKRNEKIAKILESKDREVYLPQRDTNQSQTPRKIFTDNMEAIKKSDGVIVILSDTRGIYLETGYAKAHGKKIIGLQVEETRALGAMVRNFLDHVVSNVDELVILLNVLEKKTKSKKNANNN
ncbi:nucleoside 2-deoxyribosyltransferase [archaeon]|nr:nucleoside 2-deoxyribosyltransferase [archaeon]